ncbi:FXSXX-COOH protein [Streptomyces canus]|uniref:FXSXX-COOH protein n=1 Tax=Streptomyces canus TaxID=58343 RepID=UPI00324BE6A7
METPETDVEFDDTANLSGATAVGPDDLSDSALGRSVTSVLRDARGQAVVKPISFDSAL